MHNYRAAAACVTYCPVAVWISAAALNEVFCIRISPGDPITYFVAAAAHDLNPFTRRGFRCFTLNRRSARDPGNGGLLLASCSASKRSLLRYTRPELARSVLAQARVIPEQVVCISNGLFIGLTPGRNACSTCLVPLDQ